MNCQVLTDIRMKAYFRQIKNKLCPEKPQGSNHFANAFKLFYVLPHQRLQFMTSQCYEKHAENFIKSLYIFRLHTQLKEGFNFGIYVHLQQYAPRGSLDKFMRRLIGYITDNDETRIKSVRPKIKSGVSLYDYIRTLYIHPRNLILAQCSVSDAVAINDESQDWMKHGEINRLINEICSDTKIILSNIIAFPSTYGESKLNKILNFDENGFHQFMRQTTMQQLIQDICWEAYSIALQSKTYTHEQSQQLLDPLTRRSLVIRCIDERITKEVQLLIQNHHGNIFVHPNPFVNFDKKDLAAKGVFDGMLFDPKFMISFLMCSRWFARMCMQDTTRLSNNNGHLLLYGQSGAGKSLILSTIASNIPTYTYLTSGRFQNPDILQSSILHIDEFDTTNLVSNHYKQLLDLKSSVKIDFKNLHPENVSKDVPCILSTNDDVLTVLRGINQIKGKRGITVNQYSVDAAIRRMYIVPFKLGQYDKLHGKIQETHAYYEVLKDYNYRFEHEANKLDRLFNMMVALGLFQQDIQTLQFNGYMQQYLQIVMEDFKHTIFGRFFIQNKRKIDDIVSAIEQQMTMADVNDTEYITCVTIAAGQLEYLYKKFIKKVSPEQSELVKDITIPWPIKMYHIFDENTFMQSEQAEEHATELLGRETAAFLADDNYFPFIDDIEEPGISKQPSIACSEVFGTDEIIKFQEADEHFQQRVLEEERASLSEAIERVEDYNRSRNIDSTPNFDIAEEFDYRDALLNRHLQRLDSLSEDKFELQFRNFNKR